MGPNETAFMAHAAHAAARADAALAAALTDFQTRFGCLPDGYAFAEWEDVFAAAHAICEEN
jgi:hypothetical protein